MGVGIYYFYHGFGLKAFEGRHIRMTYDQYHEYLWIGGLQTTCYVVQGCYNVCANSRHANPHISEILVNKWTTESVRLRGEGCHLAKRFQGRIFVEIDQQENKIAYGGHVC